MKISKDSWHYRMVDGFISNSPSRSLCKYFWQVVGTIFTYSVVVLLGVTFVCIMLLFLVAPIISLVWLPSLMVGMVEPGMTAWIFIGLCALAGFLTNLWKRRKNVDKEPGIVSSYVKAKKQKVCPVIEFTEKE